MEKIDGTQKEDHTCYAPPKLDEAPPLGYQYGKGYQRCSGDTHSKAGQPLSSIEKYKKQDAEDEKTRYESSPDEIVVEVGGEDPIEKGGVKGEEAPAQVGQ